jgi:hypothetical protein
MRLTRGLLAELDLLDFRLDLVAPDRDSADAGENAGDFLVAGGGLRMVLKLYWEPLQKDAEPSSDFGIVSVAQALLNAAPDIDAVVVVLPAAPYAAVVIDAFAAGAAFEVPSGSVRPLPRGVLYPSLREALRHLVAPADGDWSGLPAQPLVTSLTSIADPARVTTLTEVELAELRAEGGRARRAGPKHQTWTALSKTDAKWVAERVHGAVSGAFVPARLPGDLDTILGEVTP